MARIDTKAGRARLAPRREPYWQKVGTGRAIGLRKIDADRATWIAKWRDTDTKDRAIHRLGDATDAFGFDEAAKAAAAWFEDRERGIRGGDVETVADLCRAYLKDRRQLKGDKAANEIGRRYERTVYGRPGAPRAPAIDPNAIGRVRLDKLRARHISQWRDELVEAGLSKAAANRDLTALKAALNYGVLHRHIRADAVIEWRSVAPFKDASKRRTLFLDRDQRQALIAACGGSLRDLVTAAALTGARAGELVSARRSAFDSRTGTITLSGKTGTRTVPLAPAAATLFTRLAKAKLPTAHLLTRDDGKPWGHSDWDELVREAAGRAKLPKGCCLYTLRHCWITEAISDGMSVLEVARLVGTSLTMVDRNYGHLVQSAARERLARLEIL